jgi:hypothetical protein
MKSVELFNRTQAGSMGKSSDTLVLALGRNYSPEIILNLSRASMRKSIFLQRATLASYATPNKVGKLKRMLLTQRSYISVIL